jgi:flagellar hook-associated protein 1 FlgK
MSPGLATVLSIAKDALAAQQYGIHVGGHNIANVNTPGYSKQSPVLEATGPVPLSGLLFGMGVDTTQVMRASDQLIENRLMQQKSSLSSFEEMDSYMLVLEGLFNESSGNSLSNLIGEFWNLWHDIANYPSSASERIALYEHSVIVSEQFNGLDADLFQLNADLTSAVAAGTGRVNEITAEIAHLNNEIAQLEVFAPANDLRDKRNMLASELAEYIEMKIFEQSNGSFTIASAKGVILVDGIESYDLNFSGSAVEWQSSGGNAVDITDHISNGKLGGFLNMRDEIVGKYKQDLTELASEFIWAVNRQHSQGVGLTALSSVTGTYGASAPAVAVTTAASGLDYYDKITDGIFEVWIYDSTGALVNGGATTVTVTAGVTTLNDIATAVTALDADISASVNANGELAITTTNSHTFAFSDDTSNVLAALGINTFFTGTTAGGMGVNNAIGSDKDYIAAAQVDSDATSSGYGAFATGDNTNALAMTDLQYIARDISEWTYDRLNGNTEGTITATIEDYYHSLVGSLGIKASSISRGRAFNEVMVFELNTMRESISSVSLEEEMTQLMKYQHAFAAASKLITVSDEMLHTLIATK